MAKPPGRFLQSLTQSYPYVQFDVPPDTDGDLTMREIGAHAIGHFRSSAWAAEATIGRAEAYGFGDTIKLVWLLNGAMTYEDKERSLAIGAGEIFLIRSSSDYFLRVSDSYESLVLTFDARAHPTWLDLVARGEREVVLESSSAAAASAAGALALMRQSYNDRTSEQALHSMFELATGSIKQRRAAAATEEVAPAYFQAHWLVRQNIADPAYTPARLADDLGLSRRSLYNRFAASGITPAAFIRRVRLEQAKREIESDLSGKVSLTTIALRNGFSDNSSLSHGIKDIYGVTPRELRKARTTEGR